MNLIPLTYLKGERYRKWLKRIYIVSLFVGCIGSSISIFLPFKIQSLQEEVKKLKESKVLAYRDVREQMLKGIYDKEETLKVLGEERQRLNLEKRAYLLQGEHIFGFSQSLLNIHQVSYKGPNGGWEVVGSSKALDPIKVYKERLLGIYKEETSSFQIEKVEEMWTFSFRLGEGEEVWHESVE